MAVTQRKYSYMLIIEILQKAVNERKAALGGG
jgi:hypothetical protein